MESVRSKEGEGEGEGRVGRRERVGLERGVVVGVREEETRGLRSIDPSIGAQWHGITDLCILRSYTSESVMRVESNIRERSLR